MKFVFALFLILAMFAVSSEAGVYKISKPALKVAVFPIRHPKKSAHGIKKAGKKSGHFVGHYSKKVLD